MSMQDPVADMLTRIRNAQVMAIKEVSIPYSNFKKSILEVLMQEGYINAFQVLDNENKKDIQVDLKYHQGQPVIGKITRISKPSLRIYKQCKALPSVRGGLGIAIVSTSQGVMSDKSARSKNLGGEVLCTVE